MLSLETLTFGTKYGTVQVQQQNINDIGKVDFRFLALAIDLIDYMYWLHILR